MLTAPNLKVKYFSLQWFFSFFNFVQNYMWDLWFINCIFKMISNPPLILSLQLKPLIIFILSIFSFFWYLCDVGMQGETSNGMQIIENITAKYIVIRIALKMGEATLLTAYLFVKTCFSIILNFNLLVLPYCLWTYLKMCSL